MAPSSGYSCGILYTSDMPHHDTRINLGQHIVMIIRTTMIAIVINMYVCMDGWMYIQSIYIRISLV